MRSMPGMGAPGIEGGTEPWNLMYPGCSVELLSGGQQGTLSDRGHAVERSPSELRIRLGERATGA